MTERHFKLNPTSSKLSCPEPTFPYLEISFKKRYKSFTNNSLKRLYVFVFLALGTRVS